MEKESKCTIETRIKIEPATNHILHACSDLFSHIKHRLFADIAAGKRPGELKNDYLACYEITARQFNALRVQVEGQIASIKNRRPALIAEFKERVISLQKKIKKFIKAKASPQLAHQKKRRLHTLETKCQQLEQDHKEGTVRCCFGTKKLFRAQFALEKNGYATHGEWLTDWKKARSGELFFLGSKDETAGNQTCSATLQPDGTIQLRIRLPDSLAKEHGKYLLIPQIHFKYREKELHKILTNQEQKAITWRFLHDEKGWRLFASFDSEPIAHTSKKETGVVGLDINNNHLALVETDRYGNPISKKTVPFNLYGKSSDQAKAFVTLSVPQANDLLTIKLK